MAHEQIFQHRLSRNSEYGIPVCSEIDPGGLLDRILSAGEAIARKADTVPLKAGESDFCSHAVKDRVTR